ncbi:outer membrane beta-barrel protein [Paraburkholderia sp.]|uniref:outer membrane beta-barrel protein n=1 Tax=Paraburkholderia sp. TaxID=1926495 RepID=UPI002398ACEA|nr:outer membrane beta-barrel protein [Paraburkholderia sp.]MDE1183269.1 outer membrane beta-barrel protein [Paraburkholderia sp.]
MFNLKKYLITASVLALAGVVHVNAHADTATDAPTTAKIAGADFSGVYVGMKTGRNLSNAAGHVALPRHGSNFVGVTAGYGFDVGPLIVGAEAFMDLHNGSTTGKDGGIDAKVGMPFGRFMPYARIGITGSYPNARLHYGIGTEAHVYRHLNVAAEWTTDTSRTEGTNRRNDSFTIGVKYYFE